MRRRSVAAFAALGLLVVALPVEAGDDRKELTPFVGYRFGGSFEAYNQFQVRTFDVSSAEDYGISFDFPTSDETKVELLLSRQETDIETSGFQGLERLPVDIEYYHVGALYQPSDDEKLQPFVGGTLGATNIDPKEGDFSSETRFSFSFFGGAKVFFGEHIGLRLEGRLYGTFVNGGSAIFCGSGGCSFGFGGNAFWQGEGNLGLIIAF